MSPPLICQQQQGSERTRWLQLSEKTYFILCCKKQDCCPNYPGSCRRVLESKEQKRQEVEVSGDVWRKMGQLWRCPGFKHEVTPPSPPNQHYTCRSSDSVRHYFMCIVLSWLYNYLSRLNFCLRHTSVSWLSRFFTRTQYCGCLEKTKRTEGTVLRLLLHYNLTLTTVLYKAIKRMHFSQSYSVLASVPAH